MKKTSNQGFTLIELLVVIAIIGILSSVVLASLNTARNKGADAAIKSNMNNMRSQAELYNDGQYGAALATTTTTDAACSAGANVFGDTNIKAQIKAAYDQSGSTSGNTFCGVGPPGATQGTYWVAATRLKGDPTKAWCVSSTGNAKEINFVNALTASNTCY